MTTHVRFLVGILPDGDYFGVVSEAPKHDKVGWETIEDLLPFDGRHEDVDPKSMRRVVLTAEIPDVQEVKGAASDWLDQKKPRPRTEKHDQIARGAGDWTAPRGYGDDE